MRRNTVSLVFVILTVGILPSSAESAECFSYQGTSYPAAKMIVLSADSTTTATFCDGTAGYTSDAHLTSPNLQYIATGHQTPYEEEIDLGYFAAGDELVFAIYVRNTGHWYYTGPGERNPDGLVHAAIEDRGDGTYRIGFEDLYGGGDRDYDDINLVIEADVLVVPPGPADTDEDGVEDYSDNCIFTSNHDQADADSDGVGDACEEAAGDLGQPEVIIDNRDFHGPPRSDVTSTGSWSKASAATGHYGNTGLFASVGGEIDTYRFTPEFTGRGDYRVMVWNSCYSPRANNVQHTVVFDGGSTSVEVDQDCATGVHSEWLEFGTFPFAAGTSGYVEISDVGLESGSFIGVDAVRFLRADVTVVDDGDAGTSFTGSWHEASAATEHYGLTSAFAQGSVPSSYRFTPDLSDAGDYELFVWNSCFSPREREVLHTIVYAGGSTTVSVDQDCATGSHGEFFSLGVFPFDAGSSGYLEISNDGTSEIGFIGADAAMFVPVE